MEKVLHSGARALILDLRENGGGLLDEAVNVASIFIPDGTIVSTAGRSQPRQVYLAKGGAIPTSIPLVVLVDRGTASAAEIVTGALQDRHRALVVGTHTYGKGVFQEIQPLPNGGALDITVGEYFTPSGRNLGGGGVRRGQGSLPTSTPPPIPRTGRRCARDRRADSRGRSQVTAATGSPGRGARRAARAARQVPGCRAVLRARPAVGVGDSRRASVGDLVLLGAGRRRDGRGGRATIARRVGRPDVARDVIEALMVDRGLRRAFDPAVEHEASGADPGPAAAAAATCAGCPRSRSIPRARATSTTPYRRPPKATERCGYGSTSPTSRPMCGRARCSTARHTGGDAACMCPAQSSRCCRLCCRTAPARWCPARTGWR